jgi:tricorn protease interacting factor F2/3
MKKLRYKTLGENVLPSNYAITFEPDMKKFTFTGTERITLKIRRPTKIIRLNASELKISEARLLSKGRSHDAKIRFNEREKEVAFNFDGAVSGDAVLEVRFQGVNNDKLYGFYRSSYDNNGKKAYILSSQFEAADARAAFPCFDEPSFKATFDITMVVDKNLTAISNMPIKSQSSSKGKKKIQFQRTPVMSCYLLYLSVGKYDVASGNLGKLKINVVTVPGKKKLTSLALDYAKKFVAFYQNYFGIDYPLPKLDLLAIPDFSAGAMENWGAITFREIALLCDDKNVSVSVKQRIAEVIAHELAHQWFGDLVTMKWWNDLWLNESFATYMSYKAMDSTFPEWDMKTQYFDDVISTAFSVDALKSTHPISVNVSSPDEINELFDEISYEKGGTVLHMLETYATPEIFRKGLHIYLTKHAYSNASQHDLWDAIDKVERRNKVSVTEVADKWINLAGYPIIDVQKNGDSLELRQKRFLIVDSKLQKQVWPIPMPYLTEGERRPVPWILDRERSKIAIGDAAWAKLNYGQHYLYRVRYPDEMLGKLGGLIKRKTIKGTDSWGIENDLFVLARAGKIRLNTYLNFLEKYCFGNLDYPLNVGVSDHLNWFDSMLEDKAPDRRLKQLIIKYHKPILDRLGWQKRPNDDNITVMFRSSAISSLAKAGHKPTISRAMLMFNSFLHGKPIEPDLRGTIYGLAAWFGNAKTYARMVELYKKEKIPDEQRRFLQSLALFRDKKLIEKSLKFAYSKDVRLQDAYALPAIISGNPVGKKLILKWTEKKWQMLLKIHQSGTHMIDRYVTNLGGAYTTKERDEIDHFFHEKRNMRDDFKREVTKTLERIDANINLMKANGLS